MVMLSNAAPTIMPHKSPGLVDEVDGRSSHAFKNSATERRSLLGQFPTPPTIARYMASMFQAEHGVIRLLDAGAGVGSLTAAVVANLCQRTRKPKRIESVAYEVDPDLNRHLEETLDLCGRTCKDALVDFAGVSRNSDFIHSAVTQLDHGLFGTSAERFNLAILNPPYKKINTDSDHRRLLRRVGVETTNLYTAFLALAVLLLEPDGELVAITPRSFCNGPYFKPFRQLFLGEMALRHIHIFESRSEAFSDDEVLQENIIFHAVKTRTRPRFVRVSSSHGPDRQQTGRDVPFETMIKPDDPNQFIHIVTDEAGDQISGVVKTLPYSLNDLALTVSTGRIVDFRSRSFIQSDPGPGTVPLIYPTHFCNGWINWPKLGHKKPNACLLNDESRKWLIPAAVHVLVKRFSAKEEVRRVVASVFDPGRVPCDFVALENHLNYYHVNGKGLPLTFAKGLALFLNSTLVDSHFRQFNGHTQVNAADLRSIRYPSRAQLESLGSQVGDMFPSQAEVDRMVAEELINGEKIGEAGHLGNKAENCRSLGCGEGPWSAAGANE